MRLETAGRPHLTYCTNIHAGETWPEVRANIKRYVLAVKRRVAPDRPFGVGLRLSAAAAETLAKPRELADFQEFLKREALYVFTVNGFPFGNFHGERIKERVYLPDWLSEERLAYSDRLARLLATLLPEESGMEGSVSTVPGAFASRVASESDVARMTELLLRHAATLYRIREETGRIVSLALEPEPGCFLETSGGTVEFFERRLFSSFAARRLASLTGLPPGESEEFLRRHVGVCFDACHMAVEFEEMRDAFHAFRNAGVRVAKVQVSAGLSVRFERNARERRDALLPFAEDVYLHQVVERDGGKLRRYGDLPEALDGFDPSPSPSREWRVHFHVPIHLERLGPFRSTQRELDELLGVIRQESVPPHLEVETYTWDVLPLEHRREDIVTAVSREIEWVMARMRP